jgi:CRISPR-associated protein (TIGR03986 family)
MLRSLIEIVSFSKIEKVTKNKLFYRSLGDPALKTIYMNNFVEEKPSISHPPHPQAPCYYTKVRAGFLRISGNTYQIEECGYGRIDRTIINHLNPQGQPNVPLYRGNGPGKTPNWRYQNKTVYVQIDDTEQDRFFPRQINANGRQRHPNLYLCYRFVQQASLNATPGMKPATLIVTGNMQHKHLEFAFLHEVKPISIYQVSEEIIRRFQDDDQLTKWQEDAYPKDSPFQNCRQKHGAFRDGEPVFFLLNEDDSIHFLGRAQMFRLPYNFSPLDLIPQDLRDPSKTDLTEAIFGYVDGKAPREPARASRVFVGDAYCKSSDPIWWKDTFEETVTPHILTNPKPTTFQRYLTQTGVERAELKHYSPQSIQEKPTIRGHKLYWHKGKSPNIEHPDPANAPEKQTTTIRPIKPGVEFTFNIQFENLRDEELGALLWLLEIAQDETYRLSLGMGKPLGMGAIKIQPTLHLSDRPNRYSKLFSQAGWEKAEIANTDHISARCITAFEEYILKNIGESDHPSTEKAKSLTELPRIQMLLAMLQWSDAPSSDKTRYMTIEPNEYKERPVLPTPFQVLGDLDRDTRNLSIGAMTQSTVEKPVLASRTEAAKQLEPMTQSTVEKPVLASRTEAAKQLEPTKRPKILSEREAEIQAAIATSQFVIGDKTAAIVRGIINPAIEEKAYYK